MHLIYYANQLDSKRIDIVYQDEALSAKEAS